MDKAYYKYGAYGFEKGLAIFCEAEEQLARLQIYHLVNSLRSGDRPAECTPDVPAGRTLVEFAAAAWAPFYQRFFRDPLVPGHHREPAWLAFAARLEQILTEQAKASIGVVSEIIFDELVSAPFGAYLEKEKRDWVGPYGFGVFRYDVHEEYVALHIHNCLMPESPFADVAMLFSFLQQIVDDIARRGLKIQRIGVDSWLNNLPPFQSLFPQEFTATMAPSDPDNKAGNGWWGQYFLRTGHFHQQRAARLRESRRFDYVRTHAECSFERFCEHVRRGHRR